MVFLFLPFFLIAKEREGGREREREGRNEEEVG